jgi:hypothetical protein
MPITYSPVGGESGQSRTLTVGEDGKRAYVLYYRAETGDKQVGAKEVEAGCPVRLGDAYEAFGETDETVFARSFTIAEDASAGDGTVWLITIQYGPGNPLEFTPTDPLIQRPKIGFTSTRFQKPADRDIDDEPVVNSAGDPFDPPFMVDQTRPFMTIVRNEPYFSPLLAKDFHNALNAGPWFGRPALEWKCLDITGDESQDPNGDRYWVVTYQFELNEETWVAQILDIGMREKNAAGKKVAITDDRGREVDAPWPLNEDGSKKAVGAAADFLEFHLYREADFADLNLDDFHQELIDTGLLI